MVEKTQVMENMPDQSASTNPAQELAGKILDRIESILLEAEQKVRPLEIDPYRSQLFELFVTADAAGFLKEDAAIDLTADEVLKKLARRWGLDEAARRSFEQQTKLPRDQLSKMRMLWSFLRMWMEWTYAWQRWPEFHNEKGQTRRPT